MVIVVSVLMASVVIGLVFNFLFRGKEDEIEGKKRGTPVWEVLSATALLAALLIAIVLSEANTSYSEARAAAVQEANAVDKLYEAAEYTAQPTRQAIHAATVCYARAVVGPEWEAMAKGERVRCAEHLDRDRSTRSAQDPDPDGSRRPYLRAGGAGRPGAW